jgi:hypothetical protein
MVSSGKTATLYGFGYKFAVGSKEASVMVSSIAIALKVSSSIFRTLES